MDTVAVLLLTIFLSNGSATARAIIAPDMQTCEANRGAIVKLIMRGLKPVKVNGETVTVTKIEGYCHQAERGQDA